MAKLFPYLRKTINSQNLEAQILPSKSTKKTKTNCNQTAKKKSHKYQRKKK